MTLISGAKVPSRDLFLMEHLVTLILTLRLEEKILESVLLVDGISPELKGKSKVYFSKWQESACKDIEKAFSVLQQKFQALTCSFEQWEAGDIHDMAMTCIILHNMMVAF